MAVGKNKTSYEALEAHLESDLPEQIEVRVRRERRRRWPLSEKLRILREAFAPGAIASRVAEQYEISMGLLFTWRRPGDGRRGAGFHASAGHCGSLCLGVQN